MHSLIADHVIAALRAIARAILSVLYFLFVHVVISVVLYGIGLGTLLMLTLGRYPRGRFRQAHSERISACGALVVLLVWCGIALYNNAHVA